MFAAEWEADDSADCGDEARVTGEAFSSAEARVASDMLAVTCAGDTAGTSFYSGEYVCTGV